MTTIGHYTIPNHHTAPVCPPAQYAMCVCGEPLREHINDDNDAHRASDTGDRCPDGQGDFTLLAGDTLDCEHVTECTICGVDLCVEHSPEFLSCADTGLHHLDCASHCVACRMGGGPR